MIDQQLSLEYPHRHYPDQVLLKNDSQKQDGEASYQAA